MPQLSLHTPVGDLTVSEEEGHVVAIDWGWGRDQAATPVLLAARAQLHDYFDGDRAGFDLPLRPRGTPYQLRVWAALRAIAPGTTSTYGALARGVGGSPRSVGMANGANPIPIVIPCHRVLAAGSVGGYSGGDGVPTKLFLLELEGATGTLMVPRPLSFVA